MRNDCPVPLRHSFRMSIIALTGACVLAAGALTGCGSFQLARRVSGGPVGSYLLASGIHKIKHVIIVMQENRSFDSYFGTYPGADGIPMSHGSPSTCLPDPAGGCTRPYHDAADFNGGGPHAVANALADVDGGAMDGFVRERAAARKSCKNTNNPACAHGTTPDVMGYHTGAEIPNYWSYARNFVLDDHMFEPVKSWSLPGHLFLVSGWSARCATRSPGSCVNDIVGPYRVTRFNRAVRRQTAGRPAPLDLAWTDITWLLHRYGVSWRYYVQAGTQPDCTNDAAETCAPVRQSAATPGIWNPLPLFGDVRQDHEGSYVQPLGSYFAAAAAGRLPAVSWVTPSGPNSDHPPAKIGRAHV